MTLVPFTGESRLLLGGQILVEKFGCLLVYAQVNQVLFEHLVRNAKWIEQVYSLVNFFSREEVEEL